MISTHRFAVAGVGFDLLSTRPIVRPGGLGRYDEFDAAPPAVGEKDSLAIQVVDSPSDEWCDSSIDFDSGSWRASCRESSRLIAYVNPDDESPTVVSIPQSDDHLTVYHPLRQRTGDAPIPHPMRYPLDQAIMMHVLPRYSGVLVHSAGLVHAGRGIVCVGKSGAGKSTISKVAVDAGWRVLSDDRIIIRSVGDGYRMYGTPWPGDCGYARNESVPLEGICFLTQAAESRAEKLSGPEAFARLIPAASIPMYDKELITQYLSIVDRILVGVPLYDLRFTPDAGVIPALESLLVGK